MVLDKLVGCGETNLSQYLKEASKNVKAADAQFSEAAPCSADMFRDANTQTPEDPKLDITKRHFEQKESTEAIIIPTESQKQKSDIREFNIPIRLEMDAAGWYHRRSGAPEVWDVHSQVYIETTETTCIHLADDKIARPPYMQVTIEDVHTNCGDIARFDAVIDGSPPLNISWYKNNTLLPENERIQIMKEDRKYSLILCNTNLEDGGVYTCVARNMGGEVSCKAELVMHEDKKVQVTKKIYKRRKLKSFFEVKEEIGRGSFGFVKRVVHKGNGETCAAKFIPLRSRTRQQAYKERDILSEITNNNVTLLLDSFETKKTLVLILEICCGEELIDRLFRKNSVTEKEVKLYIRQLVEAVEFLHGKNILHLDIKPSNILMVHTDREDIKLCDFGFAQKLSTSELQYSKYGSPEFVSPEVASQSPVSKASDIWPIGVITYLCLTCASPFAGQNDRETLLNVQQGKISWQNTGFVRLSEEAKHFIKSIIQINAQARPSAEECLHHKWLLEPISSLDALPINTRSLRFLVARSRWQRSLMCYKSILVMRAIPDLLHGKTENTSLGVPRHLVECSSSSSSSGSSSDIESDCSPTERDCNPSMETHLSIFRMSDTDRLPQLYKSETEINTEDIIEKPEIENEKNNLQTIVPCDKAQVTKKDIEISELVETDENKIILEDTEKSLVNSVETSPGKPPLFKAATIEVGDLTTKKAKTGCLLRGSSADSALPFEKGVCVPRGSIINSTFYSQVSEGCSIAPREGSLKEKEFIKHRERARRTLMKAGYSQKILSGLREPLLEQFAMEDRAEIDQDVQPHSLRKSVSLDTAKGSLRSSFRVSSRSRSLDDYRSRALSVYKGTLMEEVDNDTLTETALESNKPDANLKHQSGGHSLVEKHSKLSDSPTTNGQSDKTHDCNVCPAPALISSTQRPLSAGLLDSESTIIAVLHQQPILVSRSIQGSPSTTSLGDESTVITFVQQNRPQDTIFLSKVSSVKCDTESKEGLDHAQAADNIKCDGNSAEIRGNVKLTVKTTSDANIFLSPDSPTKNVIKPLKSDDDQIFTETLKEKPIHTVQFHDNDSSIAIIHQSTSNVSSQERYADIEHCDNKLGIVKTPQSQTDFISKTSSPIVPVSEKSPSYSFTTEPASVPLPVMSTSTTQYYHEDLLKTSDIQDIATLSSQHEIKASFPRAHCELTSQDIDSQGIAKDVSSSIYSEEQCAALDDLFGAMVHLSLEMNMLAGQQEQILRKVPSFPPVYSLSKPPSELQKQKYSTDNNRSKETVCLEKPPSSLSQVMKESKATSISQCSFYDSLSQAQASPVPHEHFEDFTIDSRSSSKTFISHSDSSGTGRRSDNFSDFEEAGRHSEVSLVEIKELLFDSTSNSLEHLAVGADDLEPSCLHFFDFYDFKASSQETTECENVEGFREYTDINVTRESLNIEEEQQPSIAEKPTLHSQHSNGITQGFERTMFEKVLKAVHAEAIDESLALQSLDKQKSGSKGRKSSSSKKRIKLFRSHGKSDTTGKSSDQTLKQKVKASVANISRIIKGKQGNGQERKEGSANAKTELVAQESSERLSGLAKKKSGLSSFKLSNLSAKDKSILAPAFVEELTDQTVVVGHSVTLSCRTAQPALAVEWFKDGVSIQSSDRVLISSTLKNYQLLTILVINAQDLGIYACVASNALGSASTCCIIKKAEVPCCPSTPEVAQVYKDGALIVWKPVECSNPVAFCLQYRKEGEEWRTLAADIADCCYSTHNLCEGLVYTFRITCVSKAGVGPYSQPSANIRIGRPGPANVNLIGQTETLGTGENSERDLRTQQWEIKRGRFSVVRQCREKSSGRVLAAKIIPYKEDKKESTLMEFFILKKLHHTNIVQLHGAYLSPQQLVLILEMCEGQELMQCLSAGQSYSELEVRDYLWQILSAVEFLHAKQILHLDLRSENTVVTEHKLLKILDFGNAQFYSPDKVITTDRHMDFLETMAPELLESQGAVPPTDIWAVGITAFIMLSAEYPFSTDSTTELEKAIKKGLVKFSRCHAGLSGGAVCFLQSTLWANPWGRLSASDCLKLPWLQEAGLATSKQPPVSFPSAKLCSFLQERRRELRTKQQCYELV